MPTYTYQCDDCGHKYDAFQSMKDDAHTVCPECKGRVQRLIGAGAGIVFKGSGFYVTDYRSSDSRGADSKGAESGGAASKSDPPASTKGSDSGSSGDSGSNSAPKSSSTSGGSEGS